MFGDFNSKLERYRDVTGHTSKWLSAYCKVILLIVLGFHVWGIITSAAEGQFDKQPALKPSIKF